MIFYEQQQTVQVTFSTQDFVKVQVNYKTEAHEQTEHNDKSGSTGTTTTHIFNEEKQTTKMKEELKGKVGVRISI